MATNEYDNYINGPEPEDEGASMPIESTDEVRFELQVGRIMREDAAEMMPTDLCDRVFEASASHLTGGVSTHAGLANDDLVTVEVGASEVLSMHNNGLRLTGAGKIDCVDRHYEELSVETRTDQMSLFRRKSSWPVYAAMAAALLIGVGFAMRYGVQSIWNNEDDSSGTSNQIAQQTTPTGAESKGTTMQSEATNSSVPTIDDQFAAEFNTSAASLWSDVNSRLGQAGDSDSGWAFTTYASEWRDDAGTLSDEISSF